MGERPPGSTVTASPAAPARSDPDGLPVGWLIETRDQRQGAAISEPRPGV
jgi:hypothetical protein